MGLRTDCRTKVRAVTSYMYLITCTCAIASRRREGLHTCTSCCIPYSQKLSREKTFANR